MEMPKSTGLSFGHQNPTSNNTGNFVYRGRGARSRGKMTFPDGYHRLPTLILMT